MTDPANKKLLDEAADLYLRLRHSPDDEGLKRRRDAFLAKGEAHRNAYKQISDAWAVTGGRKRPSRLLPVIVLGLLGLSLWLWAPQVRVVMLADHLSDTSPLAVTLLSGDTAHLDAGSAIKDATEGPTREIELLRGAGFFTVTPDTRPFSVEIGDLRVTALGTAFETALLNGEIHISVFEGRVAVEDTSGVVELGAGDMLVWRGTKDQTVLAVDEREIAPWRDNELIVKGMRFETVAAILDRRLAGSIRIIGDRLADTPVTGRFDLSRPEQSIQNLVASQNARMIDARPMTIFIYGKH